MIWIHLIWSNIRLQTVWNDFWWHCKPWMWGWGPPGCMEVTRVGGLECLTWINGWAPHGNHVIDYICFSKTVKTLGPLIRSSRPPDSGAHLLSIDKTYRSSLPQWITCIQVGPTSMFVAVHYSYLICSLRMLFIPTAVL